MKKKRTRRTRIFLPEGKSVLLTRHEIFVLYSQIVLYIERFVGC